MHEFSIAQSLLEIIRSVAREKHLHPVEKVVVRIGKLAAVDPQALELAYELLVQGTDLGTSRMVIESVEPRATCLECGNEYDFPMDFQGTCPRCESPRIDILKGREMTLVSLEGEVSDGSQGASEHPQSE